VSALGAVVSALVPRFTDEGLASFGIPAGTSGGGIPKLAALPPEIRQVVQDAYGHATGNIFLFVAPAALLALLAVVFIKEVPLRRGPGEE